MKTVKQDMNLERDPVAGTQEDTAPTAEHAVPTSRPIGAPLDFHERLVRALKTTDPEVLRDAEAAYRGVHASVHDYIVSRLAERLQPPDLGWLLACCTPESLREGYEGSSLVVWSIALDDGGSMVFESPRATS